MKEFESLVDDLDGVNFDEFGLTDEDWEAMFSDGSWGDELQMDFSDQEWAEFSALFEGTDWKVGSKP